MLNHLRTPRPLLAALLALSLCFAACATPVREATVVEPPPAAPAAAPAATPAPAPAPTPTPTPAAPPAPDAAPGAASELATAPLDAELPYDPAVRRGRLANGLTYYVRANERPEERAELRLFIDAGSLQEDEDQLGLAHFVEHMAFNGTDHFAKQELVDYLESIGTRFGADLNASTSFDETVYQLKVPTDQPELVEKGVQILADWAHGVTFDPAEVVKERGVIVEEWRLDRGAGARLRDQQIPIIFRGSRYAERLPIGDLEIIENATPEALRRFYRDWYRPDLMAVVAVGDFDPERMEELIRRSFADLPPAAAPREHVSYPVPEHAETLFSLVTDPELQHTSVAVLYKHPAQPEGTYGAYRRSLVESLYHGMLNNRLAELGQEADPPYLYAYSSQGSLVRSASVFSQQAAVRDGEAPRGLAALLAEVERVERHGFTASELARAKVNVARSYEQALRERDKIESAAFAAEYGRNFLEGESMPGIAAEVELVDRFLPTITLEEVNHLAREGITEDNRVIMVSAPEKTDAPLPTEEELLAVFDAVAARDLEPYVDEVRDAPLLAAPPVPGEIVAEREIAELGVTEWTLSNGARVVLKPTEFKNDQVLLSGYSPGGTSLVPDDDYVSALFATAILDESGLGEFSQIELGKALAGKVAAAGASLSELEEGVTGFASPQDLETMLQLVYLRFTAPRLDPEAFASLMAKLHVLVQNRDSDPQTVFEDRLREALSQDHPRRQPISEAMLGDVDPQRALAVYRDRFADAGDFTFFMVGNFRPAAVAPLVATYLGGLPSSGREESWRDIGVRPPEGVVKVEVDKGLEPQSQVVLTFSGPAEWSREAQHRISSLARALGIRLREVLREDLGATYGVGVSAGLTSRPVGQHSFTIEFGCAPEEVDALVEAVFAEIAEVKANGIAAPTVAKVQEIQRRQRETDLRENAFWLQGLETYYTLGLDPRLLLEFDELVAALSPESLRDAARRFLDEERYVLGVLNPEPRQPSP